LVLHYYKVFSSKFQDPSSATQRGGLDLLLLSAIIAGAVAVVCILGILLFCLWRRKRS